MTANNYPPLGLMSNRFDDLQEKVFGSPLCLENLQSLNLWELLIPKKRNWKIKRASYLRKHSYCNPYKHIYYRGVIGFHAISSFGSKRCILESCLSAPTCLNVPVLVHVHISFLVFGHVVVCTYDTCTLLQVREISYIYSRDVTRWTAEALIAIQEVLAL